MLRIAIIAIGRLKDDAEQVLYTRYADRISALSRITNIGPVTLREAAESRASLPASRKAAEAGEILRKVPAGYAACALDERGPNLTTAEFTSWLRDLRDAGTPGAAFLLGGPDGHDASALAGATRKLALSKLTLPHGLARIVLVEQIYRSSAILANHPYHRE